MRRLWVALLLILVSVSVATGVRLHALTECERWIAEYRDTLAKSPGVQRANAVRHRVGRYVRHKVTLKKASGARILSARYMRPKMSREEALRKMEFACGSIELDQPALSDLAASPVPVFVPAAAEDIPAPPAPPVFVAQNVLPPDGGFPIGGIPIAPNFPGAGGGTPPGGGTVIPPPPPPPPPPAQTPEPGSLILMATGLAGAAVAFRRRVSPRS